MIHVRGVLEHEVLRVALKILFVAALYAAAIAWTDDVIAWVLL